MRSLRSRIVGTITLLACLAGRAAAARAQPVEVTPFGGYRFGGDFFERLTGQPVDLDAAPAYGVAVDVPLPGGMQLEGLFSHEHARLALAPPDSSAPPILWHMSVDHWLGGGLQEFADGRARPFLTGMLGLTRYASDVESEYRFTVSAGGGVKLIASPHVGLRLEGRVFTTFVDANANGAVFFCGPGLCFLSFNADLVWQAEFTAGLLVRFH